MNLYTVLLDLNLRTKNLEAEREHESRLKDSAAAMYEQVSRELFKVRGELNNSKAREEAAAKTLREWAAKIDQIYENIRQIKIP